MTHTLALPAAPWARAAATVAIAVAGAAYGADPALPGRDPTLPPIDLNPAPAPAAAAAPASAAAPAARPRHIVVVVDGRHYVIEGGQRRGVGDRLGNARIESIDDTGVRLREGGAVRRLPLYGNVARRPADDGDAAAVRSAGAATPTHAALLRSPENKSNR
jgi:hypothetical protein